MTNATDFFVQSMFTKLSSECSSARSRIRTAQTMRAVKFAADVHPNAMIRSLPIARQEVRRVQDVAETRMGELLDQQLKKLAACASRDEIRAEYGRLVRNDWCFLRGDFSRVFVRADREFHRILHAAPAATTVPAPAGDDEEPTDEEPGSAPAP